MKRQGLIVTMNQLKKLLNKLFQEVNIDNEDFMNQEFQINIINKKGLSDTWRIE